MREMTAGVHRTLRAFAVGAQAIEFPADGW
jgi:hypothetical protein